MESMINNFIKDNMFGISPNACRALRSYTAFLPDEILVINIQRKTVEYFFTNFGRILMHECGHLSMINQPGAEISSECINNIMKIFQHYSLSYALERVLNIISVNNAKITQPKMSPNLQEELTAEKMGLQLYEQKLLKVAADLAALACNQEKSAAQIKLMTEQLDQKYLSNYDDKLMAKLYRDRAQLDDDRDKFAAEIKEEWADLSIARAKLEREKLEFAAEKEKLVRAVDQFRATMSGGTLEFVQNI